MAIMTEAQSLKIISADRFCIFPKQIGEIKQLAGCDYLTIAPKLLEELKNSSDPVPKKLESESASAEKMEKVSYIDNEAAFRWALFDDTMAFDKVGPLVFDFLSPHRWCFSTRSVVRITHDAVPVCCDLSEKS